MRSADDKPLASVEKSSGSGETSRRLQSPGTIPLHASRKPPQELLVASTSSTSSPSKKSSKSTICFRYLYAYPGLGPDQLSDREMTQL